MFWDYFVLIAIEITAKSEEVSTPVEAIRFSTRQKTETVYNEEEYDIYGLEPEDEEAVKPIDQPVVEEDEGDVIEAVLDHRRCHGAGMISFSRFVTDAVLPHTTHLCLKSISKSSIIIDFFFFRNWHH